MVKRIQLSADNVTFYTLPGNSGELSNEAGQLDDTIFGHEFQSNFPGLVGWQVQANGIFKGFAGYEVGLRITGTAIAITAEPMSLVSGKTYQITATTKRILAHNLTYTVSVGGTAVSASNIESIDTLFGTVTFISTYTVSGAVTFTGSYLPTTVVGGSRTFSLTQTADAVDETTIPEAQANNGHRIFAAGLKTASIELSGVYAISNNFRTLLTNRDEHIFEICPDNSNLAVARGYFRFISQGQSGDVGALEEETVSLVLSVPDTEKVQSAFSWNIATASTLNPAIKVALDAWLAGDELYVRYLPDNNVGVTGAGVVTDISLSGGLEDMNEFTVNLQGSGQLTAYS